MILHSSSKPSHLFALLLFGLSACLVGCGDSSEPALEIASEQADRMVNAGPKKTTFFTVGESGPPVTFDDIVGAEAAKRTLLEFTASMRNPDRYNHLGVRPAKGIMLVGIPGVGKTLLARATAQSTAATFIATSGASLSPSYDPETSLILSTVDKLKHLFMAARQHAPSIVFIDELDALTHDMVASKQLGIELDGFSPSDQVYVIAALNNFSSVAPSLKRPGRFDHIITVTPPEFEARKKLLTMRIGTSAQAPDVDVSRLARLTEGFSGADIVHLTKFAGVVAARHNAAMVTMKDWEAAYDEMVVGPERPFSSRSDDNLWHTAIHESGHALVALLNQPDNPVRSISLVPRADSLGHTSMWPYDINTNVDRTLIVRHIARILGGRAAETVVFGEAGAGVSGDLQQASAVAREATRRLGMGLKTGPQDFGFLDADPTTALINGDATRQGLDDDSKALVDEAWVLAKNTLSANKKILLQVAQRLKETTEMSGDALQDLVETTQSSAPDVVATHTPSK